MAALTAASITQENAGSNTMIIAQFASVTSGATGDTWSSGLNNIVGAWAVATTAGALGITCSFVSSTGVVTLNPITGSTGAYLYLLTKS